MASRTRRRSAAAIFDLDRTLLRGASGPVISEALREAGVMSGGRHPLEPVLFGFFNLAGETRPTMLLSRQLARTAKGWSVAAVADAAALAAPRLAEQVLPYARTLIADHREAGRLLVLATTTPHDLIAPFAEAMGFDQVVATRFGRTSDGSEYDGTVDGPFVWGAGKAKAVQAWAASAKVKLEESYAYSDSYYDGPLLSSVGHPTAVNPDPRLRALAVLRRWPVRWLDVPAAVPKVAGVEPQRAGMAVLRPEMFPWMRMRTYGVNRIPESGPALLVANHRSYFDPIAIGVGLARRGRPLRFLGKAEVFDAPLVGDLVRATGGIRVDRGTGSDEPLEQAAEYLAAGELVVILPQGTIPRGEAFFDPQLQGRWGAARLAQATGVPVIPLGLWGTERVWPRSSRVPHMWNVLRPPVVTIRVGAPMHFDEDDPEGNTRSMMGAIMDLLPPESRRPVQPTEAQVAHASPPS